MDGEKRKFSRDVIEAVQKMVLFDDDFMSAVFSDFKMAEFLLKVILGKELTVIETDTQHEVKNVYGRSVRLDIYAKDSEGNVFDIEVQRDNRGAVPRRARYNNCLMDSNAIQSGEEYDKLPETYIIFITENDVYGEGEPIYEIERVIKHSGKSFGDGTHILYVNGQNRSNTDLGKLMADFAQTDPDKFHHKLLGEVVHHYKYSEEGYHMCKIVEELFDKREKKHALEMLEDGTLPIEKIAKFSGLSVEEVKALADSSHTADKENANE